MSCSLISVCLRYSGSFLADMVTFEQFSQLYLFPLFITFIFSLAITPIVRRFYTRQGWLDDPKRKKHPKVLHTYPVPRGGGIAVFLAIVLSSFLYLHIDQHLIGILCGGFLLVVVGFFDDLFDLNPYPRLLFGFVAAMCVVLSGIGIAFITNPLGGGILHLDSLQYHFQLFGEQRSFWVLSDLFALVWIVWSMNMVNWSKGLDGQLPGIVVIAASIIAFLSFRFTEDVTQWNVSILAAITAGAYLGFLPYNFYPQSIMPGYGGGTLAGFLLATLAILSGAKVATMIIVLGIPTVDGLYTIIRRISSGRSPVWGDRGHLHHRLLDFGWGKRRVAIFYWIVTAILGFIALQLNAQQKLFTIVTLTLIIGGILLWFNYFSFSSKVHGHDNG
jgi:UDP-GlcNAc:undecaprenyl-phosphate GlcNAc-1-phosphate transferase